jgi:hypothetical protein
MTLRNTEFRITFRSKARRFYYYFAKDAGSWYQVTVSARSPGAVASFEDPSTTAAATSCLVAGTKKPSAASAGQVRPGYMSQPSASSTRGSKAHNCEVLIFLPGEHLGVFTMLPLV